MKASSCTEKAPFYEQRPTADRLFQARSPYLFHDNKQSSHLEIYGQLPINQESLLQANSLDEDLKSNSQADTDPSSVLPPLVDQGSYSNGDAPFHKRKTAWGWQKIGDGGLLKAIAEVSLTVTMFYVLLTSARVQEIVFASGW